MVHVLLGYCPYFAEFVPAECFPALFPAAAAAAKAAAAAPAK
jgi:hypothetical protein